MKKIKLILIASCAFLVTGCFKIDSMEDITIYTTVYPVEYITSTLYGDNSTVNSIYPDGVIVGDYELTDKQIKDYSKSELFIFNGLCEEKKYVAEMFEYNKHIKIIDTTSSMEITNRIEELWLNPANLLMLAQNIKRGFNEYINNQYLKNSIEENYEQLKLDVSQIDADLSSMVNGGLNKTIIVTDNLFNYLTKYGLTVISLDKETVTEKTIAEAKALLLSKQIDYIFAPNNEDLTETVNQLVKDTGTTVTYFHTLSNITEAERTANKNYITIMEENIELLKTEIYE